ncbi:hypothetical protein D3C84_1244300 [compost metagenome]
MLAIELARVKVRDPLPAEKPEHIRLVHALDLRRVADLRRAVPRFDHLYLRVQRSNPIRSHRQRNPDRLRAVVDDDDDFVIFA